MEAGLRFTLSAVITTAMLAIFPVSMSPTLLCNNFVTCLEIVFTPKVNSLKSHISNIANRNPVLCAVIQSSMLREESRSQFKFIYATSVSLNSSPSMFADVPPTRTTLHMYVLVRSTVAARAERPYVLAAISAPISLTVLSNIVLRHQGSRQSDIPWRCALLHVLAAPFQIRRRHASKCLRHSFLTRKRI